MPLCAKKNNKVDNFLIMKPILLGFFAFCIKKLLYLYITITLKNKQLCILKEQ